MPNILALFVVIQMCARQAAENFARRQAVIDNIFVRTVLILISRGFVSSLASLLIPVSTNRKYSLKTTVFVIHNV